MLAANFLFENAESLREEAAGLPSHPTEVKKEQPKPEDKKQQ